MEDDDIEANESRRLLNQNDLERNDMVMVLEDDRMMLTDRNNADLQSPLRSVTDVLREAENLLTDGPHQMVKQKDNQQVIIDQVDVEYSPQKLLNRQPFEIIVRHSKVVEHPAGDLLADADDFYGKGRGGRLPTLVEGVENVDEDQPSTSKKPEEPTTSVAPFKKGHRRAWSMPNAKGEKMTLAVIHDNHEEDGNRHRRRIVKYRLHPHRHREMTSGEPKSSSSTVSAMVPTSSTSGVGDCEITFDHSEDDDELEVEINEEEVIIPGESGNGARAVVKRFWEARWKATNFDTLPDWLQDNEYLRTGHRPPIPSFSSCFKSIFALHTETGNIWTHMYGCVAFIGVGTWVLTRPETQVQTLEKWVYLTFFLGAIICLGMSFVFHTVACHSTEVSKLFSKLDYTGITLLIVGSFVPWIYFAFYCRPQPMIIYASMILILGIAAMIVSLWDKFAEPKFRPLRAGVFMAMGLSAIVPMIHLLITDGISYMYNEAVVHWMVIMGCMYIGGATIYATRIPERFFPGKCDIWFQSHQLFHTFVVLAAYVHYHAITVMGMQKLMKGSCPEQLLRRYGSETHPSFLGALLGLDEDPSTMNWNPGMIGL